MKKTKNLLIILLAMLLVIPFGVNAEETKKPEPGKDPVKVYLFRSDSCGYCEAAMEWFESIEEEYGDYFDLVDYEVSSEENYNLWSEVAGVMGDEVGGVPYMVVGKYSYPNGFGADSIADSTSGKTMGDELIERIFEIYESDKRYDVIEAINNKPDYSNIVGIAAIVVIVGFGAIAIVSRIQNKED